MTNTQKKNQDFVWNQAYSSTLELAKGCELVISQVCELVDEVVLLNGYFRKNFPELSDKNRRLSKEEKIAFREMKLAILQQPKIHNALYVFSHKMKPGLIEILETPGDNFDEVMKRLEAFTTFTKDYYQYREDLKNYEITLHNLITRLVKKNVNSEYFLLKA